jgi:opacity protein-like surface antigen
MMRFARFTSVGLLAVSAGAPSTHAQLLRGGHGDTVSIAAEPAAPRNRTDFDRRSSGSVAFIQVRPLGGLARNISFGYGGTANYVYRLDHAGVAGIRIGASFADYGRESMRVPLSYSIGGRILTTVNTDNTIGTLTLGPTIMVPRGWIRPYATAGVGLVWFATTSSLDDSGESDFSTRNYSDGTPTWMLGTGVHIPLSHRATTVLLDLGTEYFRGGEATYLKKGGIIDLPNGQIQTLPLRSETRFLNVIVGIRITP